MRLKFRHKVFLAFLLNSLLVVICMVLIARYYAIRNFEEYIGKVEMERLDEMVVTLSQEYQKSHSWAPVLDDIGHWLEITRMGPGRPPGFFGKPPFPPLSRPPAEGIGRGAEIGGPLLPPGDPPPHPPGPTPGGPHAAHISLFDAEKRPLTAADSSSTDNYRLKPILVDGEVVGWLGMIRPAQLTHPLDLEFLSRQYETFYSVGGIALVLAVFVTFLLSRHLLSPIKELAEGTRALSLRRFETRVQVRSEDEIGRLAADFNKMAQELARYEQTRRQWIADISHELRTPLAILRGEIEAMQDGVRQVTREGLESLHFEVLHVSRIVQDLHDLSLIESPAFHAEMTPVDPIDVLEETLRSFHTRFENLSIKIETNGGGHAVIMADGDRLKQLFSNLLENSLRYAHTPGVLRIFHEFTPGYVCLLFEDSGPGVPEECLGLLFDRLYRVDKARSRAQGGSGLGLAICKSIVECFGGRIEASHASSGGLRITVVFPVIEAG